MSLERKQNKYIEEYIKLCVAYLYDHEDMLFENNLSERCIAFRFAYHMQKKFSESEEYKDYYVDCDYNSSTYFDKERGKWIRKNGKPITDQKNGKITKRFIDIIVHKRGKNDYPEWSDLICFEIKKWNNCKRVGVKKDKNNLKVLTKQYGYKFGFHLIFGKMKETTKVEIFYNGKSIDNPFLLFE